jgi:lipopolysaccharide biosynthesis regulator YciM
MINKDKNKAKGLSKSAKRMNLSPEHWEENEKMRLMMAQIMMDVDKKDMADTLCKQVLSDNKSCIKAYMIMGSICEGEGSYKTAAEHYERVRCFCWM